MKKKAGTDDRQMTPDGFKAWRKALDLKQKEAADLLGLKKRMIQYYEKGDRDGKDVEIPRTVRLACYAISQGVVEFDGKAATMSEAKPAEVAAEIAAASEPAPEAEAAKPATEEKAGDKAKAAKNGKDAKNGKPGKNGKAAKPEAPAAEAGDKAPAEAKPEKPAKAKGGKGKAA